MGTRSRRPAALALVMVLLLAACGGDKKPAARSDGSDSPANAGPVTVQVGLNDPNDRQIAILQFMPALVKVPVGATVEWVFDGAIEPHSVTFFPNDEKPPPLDQAAPFFTPTPPEGAFDGDDLVNSGLQPQGNDPALPFDVRFKRAGLYEYYCVIHSEMVGVVDVVDVGTTNTPEEAAVNGNSEKQVYLAEGNIAKAAFDATAREAVPNPDGTTTWKVQMGKATPYTDILGFGPPLAVGVGDTVLFVNNSATAHTATYFGQTPRVLDSSDPRVRGPSGPSPSLLNPTALSGSGVLVPALPLEAPPPEASRSYAFVVPAAGQYEFYCVFHEPSGMAVAVTAS